MKCPNCHNNAKIYPIIRRPKNHWLFCPLCDTFGVVETKNFKSSIFDDRIYPIPFEQISNFIETIRIFFGVDIPDVITANYLSKEFFLIKQGSSVVTIPFFNLPNNFVFGLALLKPNKEIRYVMESTQLRFSRKDIGIAFGNHILKNPDNDVYILSLQDTIRLKTLAAKHDELDILPCIVSAFLPNLHHFFNKSYLTAPETFSYINGKKFLLINISEHDIFSALSLFLWANRIKATVYCYDSNDLIKAISAKSFLEETIDPKRRLENKAFIKDLSKKIEISKSDQNFDSEERILLSNTMIIEKVEGTWFRGFDQILNFDIIEAKFDVATGIWSVLVDFNGEKRQISLEGDSPLQIYRNFMKKFSETFDKLPLCKLNRHQFLDFLYKKLNFSKNKQL